MSDSLQFDESVNNAIYQVKDAVNRIHASPLIKESPFELSSADLELATSVEKNDSGELTIVIATVGEKYGEATTHTMAFSFVEFEEPVKEEVTTVPADLITLAESLVKGAGFAGAPGNIRLDMQEGSVQIKVVITKEGSVEIATPKLLEALGLGGQVSTGQARVATSSVTLNFTRRTSG